MASFVLEDFVGDGVLKELLADGWTDVPTLKMMCKDDMDALQLPQLQRDALKIRTYLHDRLLMEYADVLEASGKTLRQLLSTSPTKLTKEYKMRRGHVARFLDRSTSARSKAVQVPKDLVLPARKLTASGRLYPETPKLLSPAKTTTTTATSLRHKINLRKLAFDQLSQASTNSTASRSTSPDTAPPHSWTHLLMLLRPTSSGGEPMESKGIFSASAAQPRFCGLVKPGELGEKVTALAVLEKIMVRKLAPAHTKGVKLPPWTKGGTGTLPMAPPSRASDLWADSPTIILCLRRPGCVMCRAEAHQLYSRKPIFDAMGIQMVACLNERIDAELRSFWPRYWGGMVVVDEHREFFRALGQGKLSREGFVSGFLFNAAARANYQRAAATGMEGNYAGEGTIKGGLYQFVERNFGDWAPLNEVLQVCSDIMQRR